MEQTPSFKVVIDPETEEFVKQESLQEGLDFALEQIPFFFPGARKARVELSFDPEDEEPSGHLGLYVDCTMEGIKFREAQHKYFSKIREGHTNLYLVLAVLKEWDCLKDKENV